MPTTKLPICLSIAPHHLAALDRIAEAHERSRSWVAGRAFDDFINRVRDSASGGSRAALPEGRVLHSGLNSSECSCAADTAAGGGSFSQGETMENTPNPVRDIQAVHGAHLLRKLEHADSQARVAAEQRAEVSRRNAEYLGGMTLGKGEAA